MSHAGLAVALRPERLDDDDFLLTLHVEANAEVFAGLPADLRDTVLCQQLAARAAGHRAQFPHARREIVQTDGLPIGRIVVDAAAAAIRVVDIALLAAWRGRGIGTRLLREVLDEGRATRRPVRLQVSIENEGALRLYRRLGFAIGATSETTIAMKWRAP